MEWDDRQLESERLVTGMRMSWNEEEKKVVRGSSDSANAKPLVYPRDQMTSTSIELTAISIERQ